MFGATTYRILICLSLAIFALIALRTFFATGLEEIIPDNYKYYILSEELPELSVSAYVVFDLETGQTLLENNIDEQLPIASITKLFSAAALIEDFDLEREGTILYQDLLADGRAGKLEDGDSYKYRELLFPLLLESSNDAAVFFERETEDLVVEKMNELAQKLQLKDTSFADASGLSDQNVSTAVDLMSFAQYLSKDNPYVLDISKLKQYVGPYTGWVNNSPVIDESYLGGKHGYTIAANRTILAIFEERFESSERSIGYVILGSENLASDMAKLRDFLSLSVVYK